jgi:hypothetical protein
VAVYGSTVAVGSDDEGDVKIFSDTGTLQQTLSVARVADVAMYDDLIVARTAAKFYVFQNVGGTWSEEASFTSTLQSIAIYSGTIVAGGPGTTTCILYL